MTTDEMKSMCQDKLLHPRLDGAFWLIGPNPDLKDIHFDQHNSTKYLSPPQHQCVDHHIFQGPDGAWHLWGCIRGTPVGRILFHWEGTDLHEQNWKQTGEFIRADEGAGESIDDWNHEEWIQSPFIVREDDSYYMFYGGHGTGVDISGKAVKYYDESMESQICLMISKDGRNWIRHRGDYGYSRIFIGPGETRDPCLIKINYLWHMYFAGYHNQDRDQPGIYVRTSKNLMDWSAWQLVHQDFHFGEGKWGHECPHVVFRGGYYYLFRTKHYSTAETFVFRSKNPYDFGIGDARGHFVCSIAVAAPEIIVDESGNEYITSNHDLRLGTKLCKLIWVKE